jgi:predicted HTH transcriptional regulator
MAKRLNNATVARMIRVEVRKALRQTERTMNQPIKGTGTGRVLYVAIPGRGHNRVELTTRARQVLVFLARHQKVTSDAIQAQLRVNRNVVAGAIHELKQAKLVRSEPIAQ